MEWMDGEYLANKLDRELPPSIQTIGIGRRTAEALAHAHAKGVVHRDIKPGNLFLPGGDIDRLKVLDFGIARLTSGARKLTRTGSVIGMLGYMAPEQVRARATQTRSADVFALGSGALQVHHGAPRVRRRRRDCNPREDALLEVPPRVRDIPQGRAARARRSPRAHALARSDAAVPSPDGGARRRGARLRRSAPLDTVGTLHTRD